MRKSNKILLGAFLVALLSVLAVHLTLYAKYSSGAFVNKKVVRDEDSKSQSFPGVTSLKISSLQNLHIRLADTLKVVTDKKTSPSLKIGVVNGVLVVSGETGPNTTSNENRPKTYDDVTVYLPASVATEIDFCEARVMGFLDSTSRTTFNLTLNETQMHVNGIGVENAGYVNGFNIRASKNSEFNLFNVTVNDLKVALSASSFSENNAVIKAISIEADDASKLIISGANLRKLKP